MLPISRIANLPEDIRLNPFDVYIIVSFWKAKEIEDYIKSIWESLSFLPAIFNLRFIDETIYENFEDDRSLRQIFRESNIFAGVMGPRNSHVRIEIANININLKDRSETEIELFLFFLQLCKSNLEMLQNFKIEMEIHNPPHELEKKREYITEIEKNFKEIERYLKDKLKGKYLYRIESRKGSRPVYNNSQDRLRFLSMPVINSIRDSDGDLSDLEIKASSIGIDVPQFSPKIDPDIKIMIKEGVGRSRFPELMIQKGDLEVVVPCGFTEGIFIYTCTLLYKTENKEYRKKDFMNFLNDINYYKQQKRILVSDMPEVLKKEYQWYEDIFNALFQEEEIDRDRIAIHYKGNKNFEEWCTSLIDKMSNSSDGYYGPKIFGAGGDPVRQGLSRIRSNLRKHINNTNISSKIDLDTNIRDKGKPYKLYIDKGNIFFPNNKKWEKVVKDKSHLKDTFSQNISE